MNIRQGAKTILFRNEFSPPIDYNTLYSNPHVLAISDMICQRKKLLIIAGGVCHTIASNTEDDRMLDKNDLQTIAELIAASEERTAKRIEEASKQAVRDAVSQAIAYSENIVETKLDVIKEGLDLALETHMSALNAQRKTSCSSLLCDSTPRSLRS